MLGTQCGHRYTAPLHGGPRAPQENHPHPLPLPDSYRMALAPLTRAPPAGLSSPTPGGSSDIICLGGLGEAADRGGHIDPPHPNPGHCSQLAALTLLNSLFLSSSGPSAICFPRPPTKRAFKGTSLKMEGQKPKPLQLTKNHIITLQLLVLGNLMLVLL